MDITNTVRTTHKKLVDLLDDSGSLILDLPNGQILDISKAAADIHVDLRDGVYDPNYPLLALNESIDGYMFNGVMKEKVVYKDGLYVTHTDYNSSVDFDSIYRGYIEAGEMPQNDYPHFYDVIEGASEEFIKGYRALSGCVGWFNLFVVSGGVVVATY